MTTYNLPAGEMLSALFDGEPGAEMALADLRTAAKSELFSNWNAYQLIGQSLRTTTANVPAASWGADPVFVERLSAQLAHESIDKPALPVLPSAALTVAPRANTAANDSHFRWKMVAGFASLTAVLAVAWSVVGTGPVVSSSQFAQRGAAVVAVMPEGPMIRDPRLEELLSAHKQLGATSLQVPSGFVRNAGFQTSGQSVR